MRAATIGRHGARMPLPCSSVRPSLVCFLPDASRFHMHHRLVVVFVVRREARAIIMGAAREAR